MRALLPAYCRPLGYFVIALGLFIPFIMAMMGKVTDANLLFDDDGSIDDFVCFDQIRK